MPLPGGASAKAGLSYELLWTVRCLIRLMKGEFDSIHLEPPGEEGEGVEFAIKTKDGVEYHQAKYKLTGTGVWSLYELSHRRVLSHFYRKLDNPSATCMFLSSHAAHQLDELACHARDAGTWIKFQQKFVSSDTWDRNFKEIHNYWKSPSEEDTYERLKRVKVTTIDKDSLRKWVEDALEALVIGNPATASDVLSNFVLEHTHQELTSQDIWAHLQSRGIDRLVLRQDDEVTGIISELKETYLAGIQPIGIGGEVIPRNESSQILANFDDEQLSNIVLVTGKAGVGKSSVIAQVLKEIDERGWPLLPLRVDHIKPSATPSKLGQQLDLPLSPVSVLANMADGKDCLLVIDQLDAVSLASGRNPDFFNCIGAMLKQASRHPNMRVLAASRKFDVDNDYRIRNLINTDGIAQEVPLEEFDDATVRQVVANLGIDSHSLSPKQIELLSLPVHLRLLAGVPSKKRGEPLGFQTAKSLYESFWEEKKRVIGTHADTLLVQELADSMAESMSDRQALSVPISLLDEYTKVVDLMASENILVKDRARVSFFHESFFDYIFARRMVITKFDATKHVIKQGQSLFIRSQIRQVLLHQRDVYPEDALHNVEKILNHPDIRAHLKDIVLALLGSLDDPTADEWYLMEPLLESNLSDRVWHAINGSPAWFDLLNSIGFSRKWLESGYDYLVSHAIWFLRSVQEQRAGKVAELLSPFIGSSDPWNERLNGLIYYSDLAADRSFFEFVLKAIDTGVMDNLCDPNNDNLLTWYQATKVVESNPEWVCELIEAYFKRLIILAKQSAKENPFPSATQSVREDVISKAAESAPKKFLELLLPVLFDVIEMTADQKEATPWSDPVWAHDISVSTNSMEEEFLLGIESALRWLAVNEPDAFRIYARDFEESNYLTIQNLLLRAYEADGAKYADEAIEYLLQDAPARFTIGHISTSSDCAVRQLITAATPFCSPENLSRLEQEILNYYPDFERDFDSRRWRGGTQYGLLECVGMSRLSDNGRRRLQELRRKFRELSPSTPGSNTGGMVGSPIPASSIRKMSDDNWLSAMERYPSDRLSNEPSDWLKGGASQLSQELEAQTKENPSRFASLVHRMPDDVNGNYFQAILRGITDSGLDMDVVVAACLQCHNVFGHPFGRWITQPLTRFPEATVPDKALQMIAWYATEHPNPEPDWSPFGQTYYQGNVIDQYRPLDVGINSVRGTAAGTVAKLIFQDERYLSFFKPYLKDMANDHSDAVRACVSESLLATLRYDRDLAVDLFLDLCNADERLLATHYFERFLYYAIPTHFKELEPILGRMVKSHYEEVATAGARQVCLASLSIEDAILLAKRCIFGTVPMRIGAAEVYGTNIRVSACRAECEEMLSSLFSDADKDVREVASRCFVGFEGNELRDYSNLVEAYIRSTAFESGDIPLINALKKTTASMPSETLLASERYFELAGKNAGDVSTRMAADSSTIITLTIRVYSKATDDEVKSRCLDLIDKAILLGAYGINNVGSVFDR